MMHEKPNVFLFLLWPSTCPYYIFLLQAQKSQLDRVLQTKYLNYLPFKKAEEPEQKLYIRKLAKNVPSGAFGLNQAKYTMLNTKSAIEVCPDTPLYSTSPSNNPFILPVPVRC